ncbi:hypothetical protein ACQ4PT_019266 [Festuca glaucescens]
METSVLRGTRPHMTSFSYQKVVETSLNFKDFRAELRNPFPWSDADAVELKYFNTEEQRFLPLTCDEHVRLLFNQTAGSRFGNVQIEVLQRRPERAKGKGVQTSSVSANSQRPGTPCRSTPSKASGAESHNMPAAKSVADSAVAVGVQEDAESDEEVPNADEDEMMFPELVDRASQQAVDDEYPEEPISRARFDDTDNEEKEENMDSLIDDEYDGEDMPAIEWNREAPVLTEGTIFQSMLDCRNAVTTWCILTENTYEIKRSEPGRTCTNPVDASFGEEERWTAANAEENAAAMEIEGAEENAATLEIEGNEAVPAPCSREKRPREEETEVEPSSDGLEFVANAFHGFEAIRQEEEEVIVPVVPLKIIEPIDDRQLVVKSSASGSTPSAPPRPQPRVKKNKNTI